MKTYYRGRSIRRVRKTVDEGEAPFQGRRRRKRGTCGACLGVGTHYQNCPTRFWSINQPTTEGEHDGDTTGTRAPA